MERLFEYLVPAFVVLYFVISAVYAVLKRLSTPGLPWPAEPEEPGEAPWWEPATVEERPEATGGPPARGRLAPVARAPGPGPSPQTADSPKRVSSPPATHRPALEERGLFARSRPESTEAAEGVGQQVARSREVAPHGLQSRVSATAPVRTARMRRMLQGAGLRDAILLAEVIGRPRALRPYAPPPLEKR